MYDSLITYSVKLLPESKYASFSEIRNVSKMENSDA
jgi:hypothetical protein